MMSALGKKTQVINWHMHIIILQDYTLSEADLSDEEMDVYYSATTLVSVTTLQPASLQHTSHPPAPWHTL